MRQERLQLQLGDRHVVRRSESGQGRQQAQLPGAPPLDPRPYSQRYRRTQIPGARPCRPVRHQGRQLLRERVEPVVGVPYRLARQGVDHMPRPLVEIDDPTRQPARVQHQPGHAHRRYEQVGRHARDQRVEGGIGRDQVEMPVGEHGRTRQMPLKDALQRRTHRVEPGIVERRLPVRRGVTGGEQQAVTLAERQVKRLRQPHHHGPARYGTAALDEAQMTLGRPGAQGELQLAQPPARTPLAQGAREALPSGVMSAGAMSPGATSARAMSAGAVPAGGMSVFRLVDHTSGLPDPRPPDDSPQGIVEYSPRRQFAVTLAARGVGATDCRFPR